MATKDDGETAFLGCLLAVLMIPVIIALEALVLGKLWGWFFVPVGAPSLARVADCWRNRSRRNANPRRGMQFRR